MCGKNSAIIKLNWKHNGFFNVFIHRWCHTSIFINILCWWSWWTPHKKKNSPLKIILYLHIACTHNCTMFIYWQLYITICLGVYNLQHLDQSSHSSSKMHMRVVSPFSGRQRWDLLKVAWLLQSPWVFSLKCLDAHLVTPNNRKKSICE